MSEFDIVAARDETVSGIAGCLYRLSNASKLLTLQQRVALGEIARDLADALDQGRVLTVTMDETRKPKRSFVRTHYRDATGAPLYREVID